MLPYHAFQKFLDLMIWIYLSTTCHKYKENCITSSQTTHKNPGDARFSKFSSSENRVSHDLNNRKTKKKKESPTLDCLQSTLKPFKEPSGTMWHDGFHPEGFKISLLFHRPQGSNQKHSLHSDTQTLSFWPTKILARLTWNPIRSWFGET